MTPCCIWLFGLPCSGKTTIANALAPLLPGPVVKLDGDVMRKGLCSDLGFGENDRAENLRRFRAVTRLFMDAGTSVIVSAITPGLSVQRWAKEECDPCCLVYVATPAEVCEGRDVKGMWAKARAGEIADFTGVDAPFAEPLYADFVVGTECTVAETARAVMRHLTTEGLL